MAEIWKPVLGYEGLYEVSNLGGVRSLDRVVPSRPGFTQVRKGRTLRQSQCRTGHLRVKLYRSRIDKTTVGVHGLVLEAFVGPRPDGMECCHGDGDPTNNSLGNLRWDTKSANAIDKVRHGTHNQARKVECKRGHPFDAANTYLCKGKRECRACRREASNRSRASRRATQLKTLETAA